mgnify:CR=1 FL=1
MSNFYEKGFNLNLINFGDDELIFGNDFQIPLELAGDAIEFDEDLHLQISFFRISYDEESNQEFYLDLFNTDSIFVYRNS